jgi:hypothetical protein
MPQNKEPVQCIPVLPIKNQVDQVAFDVKPHTLDVNTETWSRYPCKLNTPILCKNDHCNGNVSFFVTNNARKNAKILTLLFVRENESAYVHFNRQLRSLFEDEILEPVAPVTIHLKPPIRTEPTKQVFPK